MSIRKINPSMFLIVIWTLLFVAPILAENKTPNNRQPHSVTKLVIVKQFGNEWRISKKNIKEIEESREWTKGERWIKIKYQESENNRPARRLVNKSLVVYGSFSVEELEILTWNP